MTIEAVFFDLDGTLADTAPDLGGALNRLREALGLVPLPLRLLRPHASAGARGLLGLGFGLTPDEPLYAEMQERFLAQYESQLCADTRLFPGIAELLDELERRDIAWGIVTNKIERFTHPLLACLGLHSRAACVISGDTAKKAKPDPAPLYMACECAGVNARNSIYVGDDERDVIAGRAAGMCTAIAAWGYLGGDRPMNEWGSDAVIERPVEVLELLNCA